jgi:hypothetical protein
MLLQKISNMVLEFLKSYWLKKKSFLCILALVPFVLLLITLKTVLLFETMNGGGEKSLTFF